MAEMLLCTEGKRVQSFFSCCILLCCIFGRVPRPVLSLVQEHQQQPRALFVANAPPTPPQAPVPVTAPAPAPVLTLSEKVVNALRAAGHYGAISGVLEGLTNIDQVIQPGTTFFAPDDVVSAGLPYNSSGDMMQLLSYHTANQSYTFQDLLGLKVGDRIATVSPGISILVESVGQNDYQLDNAILVNPDLYTNNSVAVHGINAIFFTQFYNTATLGPVPAPPATTGVAPAAAASSPKSSSSTTPTAKSHKATPNAAGGLTRASYSSASGACIATVQLLIAVLMLLFPL
ncbi:unnamed protein product [Sphagnum troendelagicum]|uniref:FAS1 domain-containing protein n=1 Tax=Sphagnum troendelagicum TaxID=128251 RepID=A0ABP0V2W0_9BRYO